jgi:hypothetical protein
MLNPNLAFSSACGALYSQFLTQRRRDAKAQRKRGERVVVRQIIAKQDESRKDNDNPAYKNPFFPSASRASLLLTASRYFYEQQLCASASLRLCVRSSPIEC